LRRCLIDTPVFVYSLGAEHPYRGPAREVVDRLAEGRIAGEASVEMIGEFVHARLRRGGDRDQAVQEAMDVADLCRLHDSERRDLMLSLELLSQSRRIDQRDAVFAATALNRSIDAILSPDRAFDDVPGLERIDPADAGKLDALAG
jgi:uncharacterized protein